MNNATKIYTVGELNTLIKFTLEQYLPPRLTVRGQLSDFKRHRSSGHCYFSLKDETGVLPCVMWASKYRTVKFTPEDGMAVLATGHIDVYLLGGKYQFYVDELQPEGLGALQLAFQQMVEKLRRQGLFDEAHKKPLPPYPQRIGIVTSDSGAAVHDIADSIFNRWPCVRLFLYPVPVQGDQAAEKIAAAIDDINRRNETLKLDLLIVGRGGGSLEDLWAFNEEIVARAIFNSKIPIISAVGHEVDTTVADLVADARASTPTKAGVVAVPNLPDVLERLHGFQTRLRESLRSNLQLCSSRLDTILASSVFKYPLSLLRDPRQRLDELTSMLRDATTTAIRLADDQLTSYCQQLAAIEPRRLLAENSSQLLLWQNRITTAFKTLLQSYQTQLATASARLQALNPKSVLKRGYSITTSKKTGRIVKTLADVQLDDLLLTELADENFLESKVVNKVNKTPDQPTQS